MFLENNAASVVEHLGIGWDVLHAANPRLIMVRFPGFGITGPYAHYKGYGCRWRASPGTRWSAATPTATRPRRRSRCTATRTPGRTSAWAVQAALLARERTGQGQLVELSQSEAVLHHIALRRAGLRVQRP